MPIMVDVVMGAGEADPKFAGKLRPAIVALESPLLPFTLSAIMTNGVAARIRIDASCSYALPVDARLRMLYCCLYAQVEAA